MHDCRCVFVPDEAQIRPCVLSKPNTPAGWQVSEAVVATLREGRADVAVFVEGPDTGGLETRLFRKDELVLVLPAGHRLAATKTPIAFTDTLDEEWISLTAGAAMLQKQQQAALAANRPLKLGMQVDF